MHHCKLSQPKARRLITVLCGSQCPALERENLVEQLVKVNGVTLTKAREMVREPLDTLKDRKFNGFSLSRPTREALCAMFSVDPHPFMSHLRSLGFPDAYCAKIAKRFRGKDELAEYFRTASHMFNLDIFPNVGEREEKLCRLIASDAIALRRWERFKRISNVKGITRKVAQNMMRTFPDQWPSKEEFDQFVLANEIPKPVRERLHALLF